MKDSGERNVNKYMEWDEEMEEYTYSRRVVKMCESCGVVCSSGCECDYCGRELEE